MTEKKQSWFGRHKVLTVLGVIILIGIIGGVAGGGEKSSTATSDNSNGSGVTKAEDKPATVAKLNEVARDGKFEFTVSGVECGKTSVGSNQYLTKTAQGQYCLANVTVKNIGSEAQYFSDTNQYLYDASGAKYSADGSASIYANPDGSTFYNQINPGNTVNGLVVFDIPKDKTPTSAELHDSAFSGGIKVNLQ